MTRRGRTPLQTGLAAALLLGSPLSGQVPRWEVEAGGTRLRYDSLAALTAPSLSGLAEWEGEAVLGRASAGIAGFGDSGWSMQGRGDVAGWFAPAGNGSPLRLEIGGTVAGTRHSEDFTSSLLRSDARLHLLRLRAGAWAGVSGARARNSLDADAVTAVIPTAGVWLRTGPARVTLSYLHTILDGDAWPEADLSVAVTRGPLDVTAYAGWRRAPFEDQEEDPWFGASAAWWVRPEVAVVASGGRYGPDLLQGIPGGDFVSVGVRFTPRRSRPVPPEAPLPLIFTRERADAGMIAFRVAGAREVSIAGDWNDWTPIPLRSDRQGRWILPAGIPPGVYRFNLLVDGTEWVVPEDVPSLDDGFGGTVGLLVISPE